MKKYTLWLKLNFNGLFDFLVPPWGSWFFKICVAAYFCTIDVICVVNFCVTSSVFDKPCPLFIILDSSSRSVNNFQFGFFRFHLCTWLFLASVCLVNNLMFIGRWSLLYTSFNTSHSSLWETEGVLSERSMFKNFPLAKFMWVGDVSFNRIRFWDVINFSINWPL